MNLFDLIPHRSEELISPEDHFHIVLRVSHNNNQGTAGDFRWLLVAAVQMFNAADILGKDHTEIEYVVQVLEGDFEADLVSVVI